MYKTMGEISFILGIIKKTLKKLFFKGSKEYWENRYVSGGNSGAGSYDKLAEFKADIINSFVVENNVFSAIEFGCGDGAQLDYIDYGRYAGYDVSDKVIEICRKKYQNDSSKKFDVVSGYKGEKADLALSLDVIYHLVEDDVFEEYMKKIFKASNEFVIIYSSNDDGIFSGSPHVKHRKFTKWIDLNVHGWVLINSIKNKYPFSNGNNENTSCADFYFYKKS